MIVVCNKLTGATYGFHDLDAYKAFVRAKWDTYNYWPTHADCVHDVGDGGEATDDNRVDLSGFERQVRDERLDADILSLERALLARGRASQREILFLPEMLTLDQAPEPPVLVLAIDGESPRAPVWQFEPDVRAALPAILSVFDSAWKAYDFLTDPEPLLHRRIPLDLLRERRAADVFAVVHHVAHPEQGGN